ncbi:ATP-grasp domain-containing protein [Xanthobacter sp. KR7-65]|uniref:ATP-grasp domain-containing protein n=1 Tax=Xanthobacter sp. KR7-65 TaxID=3156612 RepID=UPI0032B3F612
MRVLVLEYVTGGGMRGEALPPSLAAEAVLIRDAMLRDLAALPTPPEIVTTCDDRLPLAGALPVGPATDALALWRALATGCDLVWPVAPETGGVLADLVRMLGESGARVLASSPAAILAATSKRETARRLAVAGLPHIPTFPLADAPPMEGACVTKPDDGAGCTDTRLWPAGAPATPEPVVGLVIQPYVAGEAASLTAIATADGTRLLAVNRQHMAVRDGTFHLDGLTVGARSDPDGSLAALARQVAAVFPGLEGLFGIDIILTTEGPVVVEVNPRLTTAYAQLSSVLGFNAATLLPDFAGGAVAAAAVA